LHILRQPLHRSFNQRVNSTDDSSVAKRFKHLTIGPYECICVWFIGRVSYVAERDRKKILLLSRTIFSSSSSSNRYFLLALVLFPFFFLIRLLHAENRSQINTTRRNKKERMRLKDESHSYGASRATRTRKQLCIQTPSSSLSFDRGRRCSFVCSTTNRIELSFVDTFVQSMSK
jgi:hypothetical protein